MAPVQAGKRRLSIVRATAFDPTSENDPFYETAQVLMGAAILFLFLGCANVANLLLARATAKQRDWGIRASLGASRWRLARSVLSESVVLCAVGAGLGLIFAAGMVHRIQTYLLTTPGGSAPGPRTPRPSGWTPGRSSSPWRPPCSAAPSAGSPRPGGRSGGTW